jgi:Leucine-rich repeat (LRR) protein
VRFSSVLRQDLFHYYPETFAQLQAGPSLPSGVLAQADDCSVDELLAESIGADLDTISEESRAGVVTLDRITRTTLDRLEGLPSLQRISFTDEKTTVLPKEIAALERLRVLELSLNRKFKRLHKNLGLATALEALLLINLHNLTDISILTRLSKLSHLVFSNTIKLKDYTPLQQLASLRHLTLASLDLDDAAPVAATLTNLTTLDLKSSVRSWTIPAVVTLIESLPNLSALGLASADLSFGALPPLDHIEQLDLYSLDGLPPGMFSRATRLKALSLQFYSADVLPDDLGALAALEALDLSFARTLHDDTDFSALAGLSSLQYLDLSKQKTLRRVPDAISSLTALRQINLAGRTITEISALRGLPVLRCASLQGVKDEAHLVEVVMSLPALERVEVASHIDIRKLADHPSLKLILGPRPAPASVAARFDLKHSAAFLRR